eukprot:SAG22_NODE_375_length_11547_cov_12.885657_11_plen_58_part_01
MLQESIERSLFVGLSNRSRRSAATVINLTAPLAPAGRRLLALPAAGGGGAESGGGGGG